MICWLGLLFELGAWGRGHCSSCTRKEKDQAMSLVLSREPFGAMREAILEPMQPLTRQRIFASLPDVQHRTPLMKRALGVK